MQCPHCQMDLTEEWLEQWLDQESRVDRLLKRDLQEARSLTPREARFLVDTYYQWQHNRIRGANQVRAMSSGEGREPHRSILWAFQQSERLEHQILKFMHVWSDEYAVGRWAKAQVGIGPVLAAGLLAHIDIAKAPTAGNIWRFAGMDPSAKWIGTDKARALVDDVLHEMFPKS